MKKNLLCLFVLGSLLSCSADQEVLSSEMNRTNKSNNLNTIMKFTYNGKSYSSSYEVKNDSITVLSDNVANNIYQKIQELPELATYINADKSLQFFNNYKDLQKALNLSSENVSVKSKTGKLASGIQTGEITFYENKLKGGAAVKFPVFDDGISVESLDTYNFNDKASSLYIVVNEYNTYTLTLFRDHAYGGRSVSFLVPLMIDMPGFDKTWNDELTSFKVTRNN